MVKARTEAGAPAEVRRVIDVLERALARVCPPSLAGQRDDLVQAALVKLLEQPAGGEKAQPRPSSYLWQVAWSTVVDELRRLKRRERMDAPAIEAPEPADSAPAPRPDLRRAIAECLQALAADRRAAVTLHLHGFAAAEAAQALGWSVKKVQNCTYRGLDDLRSALHARGIDG